VGGCCPLDVVEMVEEDCPLEDIGVAWRQKDSLQGSGLLLHNVDRARGLLVKRLKLHIVAKGLYDGHPSVRRVDAARVRNCTL